MDIDDQVNIQTEKKINESTVIDIDEFFRNKKIKLDSAPLKKLCESGEIEMVKKRMESGQKADKACIYLAAKNSHFEVVKYLLEKKVNFTISTLSMVKNSKIIMLLLKNQDLILPPKNDDEKKLYNEMVSFNEILPSFEINLNEEQSDLLKMIENDDIKKIKEYIAKGKKINKKTLNKVIFSKKREIFNIFIKDENIFLNSTDSEIKPILEDKFLIEIFKNEWFDELNSLLSRGMEFSHNSYEPSDIDFIKILRKYPRQMKFPFSAFSIWFEREKGINFLKFAEKITSIKKKIELVFDPEIMKNKNDKEYAKAFIFCVEG